MKDIEDYLSSEVTRVEGVVGDYITVIEGGKVTPPKTSEDSGAGKKGGGGKRKRNADGDDDDDGEGEGENGQELNQPLEPKNATLLASLLASLAAHRNSDRCPLRPPLIPAVVNVAVKETKTTRKRRKR